MRERVALGYLSEVEFYSAITDHVSIPVPGCFHSEISSDGADFVLLLADMAPAVQGDQIAGCSPAEAALAVEALAGLHGPSWGDRRWFDLPSIVMPKPGDAEAAKGLGDVAVMAADITLEKLGGSVSDEDRDTLTTAMSMVDAVAARGAGPFLADARRLPARQPAVRPGSHPGHRGRLADRRPRPADPRPGLLHRHEPAARDPRRRSSATWSSTTRKALLGYGVTDYDSETCWNDYRLGVLQAPLLTTLGFAFAASTERGDEMILTMLHRGCRAIRELGSIELIDSYR